ncbi:MAG TPA: hypothetical protein VK711_00450 [Puia sp.]|jgi:hypothetical protein|nr:hypothetical protein [Puia sp.]
MSRILLSILIILSFLSSSAQFNKGDVLVGGTLSYSSNKTTSPYITGEQKYDNGLFNISLGKAIKDNALFGINLTYAPNVTTNNYGYGLVTNRTENYGIGVFYRMYKNLGKEFYIFGEAGAGYNGSTTSMKDSTGNKLSSGTGDGGNIYLTPGIAYKVSKKFFLELSIPQLFSVTYSSSNTKSGSVTTAKTDQFYANANFNSNPLNSLGVGFRLVL